MWWLLVACASERPAEAERQPERTVTHTHPAPHRADGPDVVLIVLDTLRADHLSQYGYGDDTSPGLARLAAHATRFDEAYAPSPWTIPSTTSILTGLHPLRHQLRNPGDALPEALTTLAEQLRGAGWHTAGWSYNVNIAPRQHQDQGFDEFTHSSGEILDYPHAGLMTSNATSWLRAHPDWPSFVYLQPMNCHGPYKVPKGARSRLLGRKPDARFKYYDGPMKKILKAGDLAARDQVGDAYLSSLREQYDTAIRYETDQVGELLDALEADGRFQDALVVLTADHGEELFDHGGFSHGYSLHREVLRVPLWVKLPGQTQPAVVAEPVSIVDIAATVLDTLGLPAAPTDGRSLRPYALAGASLPPRALVFDVQWPERIVAQGLLRGSSKYIRVEKDYQGRQQVEELFDLRADPHEQTDRSAADPTTLAALRAELEAAAAQLTGGVQPENVLSEMDREQLRALGYAE